MFCNYLLIVTIIGVIRSKLKSEDFKKSNKLKQEDLLAS